MSRPLVIACVIGSSRPGNYTSKAMAVVVEGLRARGCDVRVYDPAVAPVGFPGFPATDGARVLQETVRGADGVIFSTPEYHGAISAQCKLLLENMGYPSAVKGKPVALLGAASGVIGAIKALEMLRSSLSHMGAVVLPGPISVARVNTVFTEDGVCTDERMEGLLVGLGGGLVDWIEQHTCPDREMEAAARG